jgi:hypothetical protein
VVAQDMGDAGNAGHDQVSITVPFRISPSTGPRPLRLVTLFGLLVLLGGWVAIDIGIARGELPPVGSWEGVSWSMTSNGHPSADGVWLWISLTVVAIGLTLFNLVRELVYLGLSSRYRIDIAADGMTLVSPLGSSHYRWDDVPHLSVRRLPFVRGLKVLRVTAKVSWLRWVWIRSDDFASDLDTSREEAARIFAAVLNELGDQLRGKSVSTVMLPADLRVAPIGAGAITAASGTRAAPRTVVRQG